MLRWVDVVERVDAEVDVRLKVSHSCPAVRAVPSAFHVLRPVRWNVKRRCVHVPCTLAMLKTNAGCFSITQCLTSYIASINSACRPAEAEAARERGERGRYLLLTMCLSSKDQSAIHQRSNRRKIGTALSCPGAMLRLHQTKSLLLPRATL